MIKRQGTDGGTRGALASIIGGIGGRSASVLVLLCIKKLHDAHLEPVDLALDGETKPHEVSRKIVDMLRDQEFFSGPSEQALLTSKGHKSIRTASANGLNAPGFSA